MRPLLLLLILCAVGPPGLYEAADGADLTTIEHPSYPVEPPPQRAPMQIYQNYDITTIGDTQVACGIAGEYTVQNWFARRFYLYEDHGNGITVQSLDFAVSYLTGDITVDVITYTIPSGVPLLFANLTEKDRRQVHLGVEDVEQWINVPIDGCGDLGIDLVVAISAPDCSLTFVSFYPGANDAGAFQDAWIASAECGIPEPIGVSDIGFPDSQTLFVVNGEDTGCIEYPVATKATSWGAVKRLYR